MYTDFEVKEHGFNGEGIERGLGGTGKGVM